MYQPPKRKKRRRKGGIFRRLLVLLILFVLGYGGFFLYYRYGKPYTVALDAGHGGEDVGSVGVIQEVQLTEPWSRLNLRLRGRQMNGSYQ